MQLCLIRWRRRRDRKCFGFFFFFYFLWWLLLDQIQKADDESNGNGYGSYLLVQIMTRPFVESERKIIRYKWCEAERGRLWETLASRSGGGELVIDWGCWLEEKELFPTVLVIKRGRGEGDSRDWAIWKGEIGGQRRMEKTKRWIWRLNW